MAAHPEYGARPSRYIQASAHFFPITKNRLDVIFLVMTFHCLPQSQQVVTEAWRADELRTLAEKAGLTDITVHHRPGKENGFMQWLIAHKPAQPLKRG